MKCILICLGTVQSCGQLHTPATESQQPCCSIPLDEGQFTFSYLWAWRLKSIWHIDHAASTAASETLCTMEIVSDDMVKYMSWSMCPHTLEARVYVAHAAIVLIKLKSRASRVLCYQSERPWLVQHTPKVASGRLLK